MSIEEIKKPKLSVVILCYRAEELVYDFVIRLKQVFQENNIEDYELVLVGNYLIATTDKTPRVVRKISKEEENVEFVAELKKGMMGWDMKSGFKKSRGDYIAVIDGDGQMPIIDLVRVYAEIIEKRLDFVKTYRVVRGDGPWRKSLSFFYNRFFCVLFPGLHSKDINSKPKIMKRELLEKLDLKSNAWFIDAEIMIQIRRFRAKIGELPTEFLGLSGKRKSFVRFPAILEFIFNLFLYRLKEFKHFFK